ncbi:RING finger and WD repeat domain-containing protein 3 [Coemansia sp. IMI 203386]|nr:RING finger and WD repeat domain-containing protein 3 [Coemansia sp. IMI 203386]
MEDRASAVQAIDDMSPSPPSLTQLLEQNIENQRPAEMQHRVSDLTDINQNPSVTRNASCMSLDLTDNTGTDNAVSPETTFGFYDCGLGRVRKRHCIQQSLSDAGESVTRKRAINNNEDDDDDDDQEFQPKGFRSNHNGSSKPVSFFPQINVSAAGMAAVPSEPAQGTQNGGRPGDDDSDSTTCPICLDTWGVSGPHRLVALKCGHLFGQSCVRKWLMQGGRKAGSGAGLSKGKCPECNQAATRRDMRPIFARSIVAVDDGRLSELQKEVNRLAGRTRELEADVAHFQLKYMQMRNEVKRARNEHEEVFRRAQVLELQNAALEKRLASDSLIRESGNEQETGQTDGIQIDMPLPNDVLEEMSEADKDSEANGLDRCHRRIIVPVFRLCSTTQIAQSPHETLRVLAVDPHEPSVYTSFSNSATRVHTMVRVDIGSKEPVPFALPPIHKDEIRGAEISPFPSDTRYLLTASMDQTAAIIMLACVSATSKTSKPMRCSPVVVARLNAGAQAWSCAWDACDPNKCYIGTAGGRVVAFDLRHPSAPLMVWDGPRSGAVYVQAPDQPVVAPNYSPIHSMAAIPLASKEGGGAKCRLVVANAQHIYALPEHPKTRWIRLTGDSGDAPGRSCLSISYDARTSCVGASFRASDRANSGQTTVHEMYEIGFEPLLWQQQRRISVPSAQSRWARSTAFSCSMATNSRVPSLATALTLSLFGAAIEAQRCVRLWDVKDLHVREVASLDVSASEDIVDVRAGQWSEEPGDGDEPDEPRVSPAIVVSLTTSILRIYQIE